MKIFFEGDQLKSTDWSPCRTELIEQGWFLAQTINLSTLSWSPSKNIFNQFKSEVSL